MYEGGKRFGSREPGVGTWEGSSALPGSGPQVLNSGADEGCRLFDLELAAYLEGEVRPQVTAHVQHCPFCFSVLADLEGICSVSGGLSASEPPTRLWTNIRAALIAEGIIRRRETLWWRVTWDWFAGSWFRSPAAVAALGCLLVLGIGLVRAPRTGWRAPSDESAVPSAVALALGPMETSYRARVAYFEPSVKETFQKSLDSLDRQIRECLRSVKQEPDNSLAREYLLAAYEQKARVLESALYLEGR
jgi:hypothetical protein